jgi:hypothetical protein
MFCRVCGDQRGVKYRARSRLALCPSCHRDTPAKVTRAAFERVYWGGRADDVPAAVRAAFWDDYRHSGYGSVASYKRATTSPVL